MFISLNVFFQAGMKRHIPPLLPISGDVLELGPGNNPIPIRKHFRSYTALDYPDWNADTDQIPIFDRAFDHIIAFHFLEHCSNPVKVLRECERVLKPYGSMLIVVPHAKSLLADQDLDHKSRYVLDTWKTLFSNNYYDKGREVPWKFTVRVNFIMGVKEDNLAIFTQLVKEP